MAFRMKGFSAFTKKTDPPNEQDPPSGRTKLEELKTDLLEINKSIESLNISNTAAIVFHYINRLKK